MCFVRPVCLIVFTILQVSRINPFSKQKFCILCWISLSRRRENQILFSNLENREPWHNVRTKDIKFKQFSYPERFSIFLITASAQWSGKPSNPVSSTDHESFATVNIAVTTPIKHNGHDAPLFLSRECKIGWPVRYGTCRLFLSETSSAYHFVKFSYYEKFLFFNVCHLNTNQIYTNGLESVFNRTA